MRSHPAEFRELFDRERVVVRPAGRQRCLRDAGAVDDRGTAHPRIAHRGTFLDVGGVVQPGPAPRFSTTPSDVPTPPARPDEHTDAVLGEAGLEPADSAELRRAGIMSRPVRGPTRGFRPYGTAAIPRSLPFMDR
ncbi:MAG: hypothetical protein ACXV5Q_16790, partial [Frankiaceae bacterium]